MNKTTIAVTDEQYTQIINTITKQGNRERFTKSHKIVIAVEKKRVSLLSVL